MATTPRAPMTQAEAEKPLAESMRLHRQYQGKIAMTGKAPITGIQDWAYYYTPGVAAPCRAIEKDTDLVYDFTNKGNTVAVVTDGSRVLGLGNIGGRAGLPVMEGKALIYKYFGGVDAFPICLKTQKTEDIINVVKWMEPSFGGINLEDIASPKCFTILDRLRDEMEIPVWHDDQQGTATVVVAGLINALKVAKRSKATATVALIGAGAANVAILDLMLADGYKAENIIMVDSRGTLNKGREDIEANQIEYAKKWMICNTTNAEGRTGGIKDAMRGMDVVVALSQNGPGIIKPEWVKSMAKDPIVFACANPTPEIWPWEATQAGAKVVATGRSDFANQVNNSMGFPGIFRGALDVRARRITNEMCLAAAQALAAEGELKGLDANRILPAMDDPAPFIREAVAVGLKAQEQGVARVKVSEAQLRERAHKMITTAQAQLKAVK